MKYEVPAGTILPVGGYLVFDENHHFGNAKAPGCRVTFGLSRDGETVYLHSGRGGVLTGYSEQQEFGPSEEGVSFGRTIDAAGDSVFVMLSEPTPDAANSGPQIGP
jgi:hypothetical protein